jgi:diguanylate cyclase (GGDEF)-like protein
MPVTRSTGRTASLFDAGVFVLGLVLAGWAIRTWLEHPGWSPVLLAGAVIVAVMGRFPLIHTAAAGDVVIGFEACGLVFLALTAHSTAEALSLWALAVAATRLTERKSLRSRLFNVGIGIAGAAAAIPIMHVDGPWTGRGQDLAVLGLVGVACLTYFILDLVATGISLALDAQARLRDAIPGRSVLLAVTTFVGVDSIGYLAALLYRYGPRWSPVLVLVPVGTILAATRMYSRARAQSHRLTELFAAAAAASEWRSEEEVDAALLEHVSRMLPQAAAELRQEPAGPGQIGTPYTVDGRPERYLVARPLTPGHHFFDDDARALDTLAVVSGQAAARTRLLAELEHRARHDALTGLANRTVFTDRLSHALELSKRSKRMVAVLYCDLDGFKTVNDELGHDYGDRVLAAAAERLRACIRPSDTIARIGGDEFAVLLEDIAGTAEASAVATRLVNEMKRPLSTERGETRIGISIGIASTDAQGRANGGPGLLHNADLAMYRAKALGRNRIEMFRPGMRGGRPRRTELEDELRQAIIDGEIAVHYQPVVDLQSGAVAGIEALARWQHRALGPIPPDIFVPVAERGGLITELGRQVLATAFADIASLRTANPRPFRLSVNLSPRQLLNRNLVNQVDDLVARWPDQPLTLELTEGTLLSDDSETAAALSALRDLNVGLAVDDFGVGYSSIGYLQRFPIDTVKIDKSFVSGLAANEKSQTLVQAVMGIADALRLRVIAEGVEDWGAVALLREMGCRLGQGHLFARAMPLADLIEFARPGAVDLTPADSVQWVRRNRVAAAGGYQR